MPHPSGTALAVLVTLTPFVVGLDISVRGGCESSTASLIDDDEDVLPIIARDNYDYYDQSELVAQVANRPLPYSALCKDPAPLVIGFEDKVARNVRFARGDWSESPGTTDVKIFGCDISEDMTLRVLVGKSSAAIEAITHDRSRPSVWEVINDNLIFLNLTDDKFLTIEPDLLSLCDACDHYRDLCYPEWAWFPSVTTLVSWSVIFGGVVAVVVHHRGAVAVDEDIASPSDNTSGDSEDPTPLSAETPKEAAMTPENDPLALPEGEEKLQ